jgi:hypothetical protein
MTDDTDNVIDVTGKLPDPNLHTRWRKRLPDFYLQELDKLKAHYDALDKMAKDLTAMRGRLLDGVNLITSCSAASAAIDNIDDSLVLLRHAHDELMHSMPLEIQMSREDIRRLTLEIERDKRR